MSFVGHQFNEATLGGMGLAAAGWPACSNDPRSYAGRNLVLLGQSWTGLWGMGTDESCILVFQAKGFGSGLTTQNCKQLSC